MPWRPRMIPPVGKSGPGMILMRSSMLSAGSSISAVQASITSPRLCGGMLVAMRMVFGGDVANDARGLDVFLVGRVPLFVHRIQNAPMHGLQPVARIRQRARHDHAHGVIEVGAFHLVEDGNGTDIRGRRRLP